MKLKTMMPRRLPHLSIGILALTLLVGGATLLSGASKENGDVRSTRVEFVAPEVFRVVVDAGQAGLSPGDQIIIKKFLVLKSRPDKQVGEDHISCLVTEVKNPHTVACLTNVAYWFEGGLGQVTAAGVVFFDLTSSNEFDIAITGGSGEFKDAAGFVHIKQTPAEHFVTFHLNRPAPRALR